MDATATISQGSQWNVNTNIVDGQIRLAFTAPPGGEAWSKGTIGSTTNLNNLRSASDSGSYVIRANNATNGPPVAGDNPLMSLEVLQGANNGVLQRVTTINESWWRNALTGTTWAPWQRFAAEGPDGLMPLTRNVITSATDVNEFNTKERAGDYGIRTTNMVNGPDIEENIVGVLQVRWGANNGVSQRYTTANEEWWRGSSVTGNWGPWNKVGGGAGDITSPVVTRIIASTDPDTPLEDGDLLIVLEP